MMKFYGNNLVMLFLHIDGMRKFIKLCSEKSEQHHRVGHHEDVARLLSSPYVYEME